MGDVARWRPKPIDGVDWVSIDGEVVVLDPNDGIHLLADSAALIWPFLDGEVDLATLAADVSVVTGAEVGRVLQDLADFCASACAAGVLDGIGMADE